MNSYISPSRDKSVTINSSSFVDFKILCSSKSKKIYRKMETSSHQNTTAEPNDRLCNKSSPYKLVILGEAPVGKTALIMRFIQNQFEENTSTTIGAHFARKTLPIGSKVIDLQSKYLNLQFLLCSRSTETYFSPILTLSYLWNSLGYSWSEGVCSTLIYVRVETSYSKITNYFNLISTEWRVCFQCITKELMPLLLSMISRVQIVTIMPRH